MFRSFLWAEHVSPAATVLAAYKKLIVEQAAVAKDRKELDRQQTAFDARARAIAQLQADLANTRAELARTRQSLQDEIAAGAAAAAAGPSVPAPSTPQDSRFSGGWVRNTATGSGMLSPTPHWAAGSSDYNVLYGDRQQEPTWLCSYYFLKNEILDIASHNLIMERPF